MCSSAVGDTWGAVVFIWCVRMCVSDGERLFCGVSAAEPGAEVFAWHLKNSRFLSSRIYLLMIKCFSVALFGRTVFVCVRLYCKYNVSVRFLYSWRSAVHSTCLSELCCSSLKAEQVHSQMDPAGHH